MKFEGAHLFRERLRLALQEKQALELAAGRKLSETRASKDAGLGNTFIRDQFRRPTMPNLDSVQKLSAYFGKSPAWFSTPFGAELNGALAAPQTGRGELRQGAGRFVSAKFAGVVEAGSFREVDEFEDPDRETLPEPADREFPEAELFYFDVAGDSMNNLKPRPILPGDRLIAISFEGLRGRVALRDGMVVVVEQTLDGGLHRERSVKQVEIYEDRFEFCPRSSNPRHKPIVVPRDVDPDDGRVVAVVAIVRRISNELPL